MAEIKNTFLKSKMNKDLDERILPRGEYRDAENISISRSEGSDVGALENIKGNKLLTDFGIDPTEDIGVECIGQIVDEGRNRIFALFTNYSDSSTDQLSNPAPSTAYCSIICYEINTNTVTVLVKGSFLNLSKTQPIYGINILEDLLFWTDNRNQPRKINIESALAAPATSINPYYDIEETISVAKYYPFESIDFKRTIEIDVSITTSSATADGYQSVVTIDPLSVPNVEDIILHPGLQFYIKTLASGTIDQPEFPYFYQIKRYPEAPFITYGSSIDVTANYVLTPKTGLTPASEDSTSGYFTSAADYIIGDFTTYLDGKIYKAIAPQTGAPPPATGSLPPPNASFWEEVPSTLDYTKFETNVPITNNGGTDYNGTATIVLVYPEITNATEQWLPATYRGLVNSTNLADSPSAPDILPAFIESEGLGGVQLPKLSTTGGIFNTASTPGVSTAIPVEAQKSIGNVIFRLALSSINGPNGFGNGVAAGVGYVNKRNFFKYALTPGMRVNTPWLNDDNTYVIDQIFPNGFNVAGSEFAFSIKKIDVFGDSVVDWTSDFIDHDPTLLPSMWMSFSYPNPFYKRPFSGDEFFLEDKLSRLSYRFKFDDGEYSIIAPFTQSIFLPKDYGYFTSNDLYWDNRIGGSYTGKSGYVAADDPTSVDNFQELGIVGTNRLMENMANQLNLSVPMPFLSGSQLQVKDIRDLLKIYKIEILYKDDNETAVKVIKTIDTLDNSIISNTNYQYNYYYNGEKPIRTLPEKEIIRVYDKVPVRALGQEVVGNRVMYANFIDKHTSPKTLDYSVGVGRKFKTNDDNSAFSSVEYPNHSLKQNRTYKVGIILSDKFGRQSDVITAPVVSDPFIKDNIAFTGDTANSKYLRFNEAASPLVPVEYPAAPAIPVIDLPAGRNIVDWVGNTIKFILNSAIPTTGDPGYPGLYNKDTNPLGWYSYKIVVKQQEQDYYNIYLNGIKNGEPYFNSSSATNQPNPNVNNLAVFPLLGDNINKIPINNKSSDQNVDVNFFSSDVKLYPRITPSGGATYSGGYTGTWSSSVSDIIQKQVFNDEYYEKVVFIGNVDSIYGGTGSFTIDPNSFYKQNADPFVAVITNDADIGYSIFGLTGTDLLDLSNVFSTDGKNTTLIGVIETNPTISNLDIYWETSTNGLISDLSINEATEIKYFNTFWNKKLITGTPDPVAAVPLESGRDFATFPGPVSFGDALTGKLTQNADPTNALYQNASEATSIQRDLYIEESRIFGGFNNDSISLGVRAYLNEEESLQEHRFNSIIYSGIYNSRTGINATNVFSVGENITKSVDPKYRSIQKLYAEDTNLIIFQEDKVNRALIDKDAIYSAEGGGTVTSSNVVIGQTVPYLGEFGISTNPESFAIYGFQKYFVDRERGSVIRLSRDGLTEISRYGMVDYFRDNLAGINNSFALYYTTATLGPQGTTALFDVSNPDNNLELGSLIYITPDGINYTSTGSIVNDIEDLTGGVFKITSSTAIDTTTFTNLRFYSYKRGRLISGWNIHNRNYVVSMQENPYFVNSTASSYDTLTFEEDLNGWVSKQTYKPTLLFSLENKFYSVNDYKLYEHYNDTVDRCSFYGVANTANITFIMNDNPSITKNFNTIGYEGSNGWQVDSFVSDSEGKDLVAASYVDNEDTTNVVMSYDEGKFTDGGVIYRSGFNRKENRYVANLVSSSARRPGEVIFGNSMSGIKGHLATVKMSTDATTNNGGPKELFAVSSNFVISSY